MQISPISIKILRKQLEYGDIKKISDETGYSERTINTIMTGQAITNATRKVLPIAIAIVKERQEENAKIEKELKKVVQ